MSFADLIVHNAGQLITCASGGEAKRGDQMLDIGVVQDGAVAVTGGKIAAVGKSDKIFASFEAAEYFDAGGRVVCPGFVDPHTHIVYAGSRLDEFELKINGADYLAILGSGGGIISTVRRTREASFEQLVEQGLTRLDKMLACGTTTCEIKTGYGLDAANELKMLAVIAELDNRHPIAIIPTLLAAHASPPEFKSQHDSYLELVCSEILPSAWRWYESSHFAAEGTPFFCDIFAERNAFTVEHLARLFTAATELGFAIKAHAGQFSDLGASRAAIEFGAASIDHLDHISDDQVQMLAESRTIGVVIPTENFSAGKRQFADARKLIDAGCALAVSTDYNPGSAPCPSQPMAMAIASRYQGMQPAECMNATTINAAFAVGAGRRFGSIELGKDADLLVLECTDFRQVVYEFGGNLIAKVFKAGSLVHEHVRPGDLC